MPPVMNTASGGGNKRETTNQFSILLFLRATSFVLSHAVRVVLLVVHLARHRPRKKIGKPPDPSSAVYDQLRDWYTAVRAGKSGLGKSPPTYAGKEAGNNNIFRLMLCLRMTLLRQRLEQQYK